MATCGTMAGIVVSGCVSDETPSSSKDHRDRETKRRDTADEYGADTVSPPSADVLADESRTSEEGTFVAYDFSIDFETQFKYNINFKNNSRFDVFHFNLWFC